MMTAFNFFSHGTQDLYPTFLQKQHGFDHATVSTIAMLYNIAAILGGLTVGALANASDAAAPSVMTALVGGAGGVPLGLFHHRGFARSGRDPDAVPGARRLGRDAGASERDFARRLRAAPFPARSINWAI